MPQSDLVSDQKKALTHHEAVITKGLASFVAVGNALIAIRDQQLYKVAGHKSFDDYCSSRWGFRRAHAYRLVDAARVVTILDGNKALPPPSCEAQARELAPILRSDRTVGEQESGLHEAWKVANTKGKPTASRLREIVSGLVPRDVKPQKPRVLAPEGLVTVACPSCDYKVMGWQHLLTQHGPPRCPCGDEMMQAPDSVLLA